MGRVALGSMAYVNGRLAILMSANDASEDERPTVVKTQNYAISCWITFLENPNAPAGGRFVFTDPVFLDYGIPNPGQMESGEFTFPLDVWRQSSYYDRTYERYGYRHVTPGTAMCKLVPQGPNGPELVRVSLLPGEPSAADNQYSEMQIVRLYRQLGASADWYNIRRTNQGIRESFGTDNAGGGIDWSTPAAAWSRYPDASGNPQTAGGQTRTRIFRSAMGNIVTLGNLDMVNRRQMAIRLALDEAPTFTRTLKVEDQSEVTTIRTSYADGVSWIDPATGKSMIGFMADYGRGIGTAADGSAIPGNFYWYQFEEPGLIAGTITTAQSMASRQLANSIQYTGT